MSGQRLLQEHSDRIRLRIAELGLDEFQEKILNGAYSAYDLVGDKQADSRKIGTTRFGGHPDVPRSFDTAELEGFEFIFQVNLADLQQGDALGLPTDGLLSVFSDCEPYYGGKTFYFELSDLLRHRMPDPMPDYIFSNMKPWKLKVATSVGFPEYGDDLFDEIEAGGLDNEYEQLCHTTFNDASGFAQILGRFSDLNGDMRKKSADRCGGKATDWLSLWKVFSSFESGLVISDFHQLHGMIRKRHLKALNFSKMFSGTSNG